MARINILLCTAAALLNYTGAFTTLVGRREIGVISTIPSTRSPLFQQKGRPTRLFESTEDIVDDNDPSAVVEDDDINSKGGLLKIILISVPLFCKFCIVLMVKFLTDLVVYPLLILYRLARLTKRRFLKLVGMDTKNTKKT